MYKNNKINIFSHLLIWFILFSMPYVLSLGKSSDLIRTIAHFWIPIGFYAVIFYLNYFVIIDRFLFTRRTLVFIGVNMLLITFFIILKDQIDDSFYRELIKKNEFNKSEGPPFRMFMYIQMLSYLAPLLFAIAIKTTQRYIKTEADHQEAAQFKLQSELQHLHYQLQPHFFFNSLNNIYSMVDISPDEAKKAIHSLSKLMRYMLYETNSELVPLSKETDFLKKYIDLMKLRVSEKTSVSYQFPTEANSIQVAPLLFISLIENAFKHGVSANKESHIKIQMTTHQKTILFSIENQNFPKQSDDKSGSGIGLTNLEQRLKLLYPNKHTFNTLIKDDLFIVQLEIETT
ncbi:sensor histidine kinase [Flavobacterium sp. 7A]|uniref:sensor histidine kinase n=1 Tax=Flavobacterium sp. 7A TaxID=2940571 RepID=UPI0022263676|nr:histidine kinase [Flavobacterium sp. 7A]MCW2118573.1 sensor histidine kinase YesM [Flavobacterium sp. 7A]